jgi:hypothetical protein
MTRAAGRALLVAGVLVALAGCGGTGSKGAAPSAPRKAADARQRPDDPLARAAALRSADFPENWTQTAQPMPEVRCSAVGPHPVATGLSISSAFADGQRSVQQAVMVFADASVAERAYGLTDSRRVRSCFAHLVRTQAARHRGRIVGRVERLRLSKGTRTQRARFWGLASAPVQTPLGPVETLTKVYADIEVTRIDRGVSLTVMLSAVQPFDRTLQRQVDRAVVRGLGQVAVQ